MDASSFLSSDRFQQVVAEYYPSNLHDQATRHAAYREQLRSYSRAAEMAAQAVERTVVEPLVRHHTGRFFCRLDRDGPFTKSPASVDDKIFRYLTSTGRWGPMDNIRRQLRDQVDDPSFFLKLFFRDLPDVMNDLGRFRIVANMVGDVQDVAEAFNGDSLATYRIQVDPNIEDRIEADRWEEGASGHRAVHLRLWVPDDGGKIPLEVQVISIFELGWDLKSHLLYELRRRGEDGTIDKRTRLKVRAISDALYLADVLFDEVYERLFRDSATS